MASSSLSAPASLPSSSARPWKFDVFLSFRGPDTRKSITSELYDQLQNKRGINTFMDNPDLRVGDEISPTLLSAIEESRFAIVVLSKEYASSTWCLEELTKICQYMKDGNRILPVFYHVDPTDVRFQKNSFQEAFIKHENSGRHVSEKVQQWRDALNTVASFSGWHIINYKSDKQLVETIVEDVCTKVGPVKIKTGDFEIFAATRLAMEKVMKALEDDRVTVIGVHGMGGVGKTAMVKHVGAQAQKNGIFHYVVMAVVSQSPDFGKVQKTLADLLGFKFKEKTEVGRASRLNKEIMKRNKTLIILDDIWASIDLSTIGLPNYEELKTCKSKVLLTTRIQNVCHVMRCQEKICLDILSADDSWTLFVRNAGRSFESTKFVDVARKVASECCGLPIALIAVAKALGDKDFVEWKLAAQRLEKSQTANPDDRGEAFKCIKLSYDYLKDEDYKSCFLLCCLFPEDCNIEVEDLFRYAFGKGLFRDADTIEEARGTAVSVVKHLKSCSLLLDCEKKGCVRVHDVIRDTAIEIARSKDGHGFFVKAGCGLKDWPNRFYEGDYSAASLMKNHIHKLPKQLVCPKLHILLLQENYFDEIPEAFFESLKELRVLDLSKSKFSFQPTSLISFLPQSLSLLTNLQALYLDFCRKSIDTSLFGNLKKLEILSMRHYPNRKLSAEIGQLTNLRMLDISEGGRIVTIPSKVISKLHRLEELYMLDCGFKHWGSIVKGEGEETNIGFAELVGLTNLKILQVDIFHDILEKVDVKPNWDYFHIRIGTAGYVGPTNRYLRYLSLFGNTTISTLPDWFVNAVTEKTEVLEYYECEGSSNILMEFDYGRLNELKRLNVEGDDNLVELMNSTTRVKTEPVFKNLEELHLNMLWALEELCVGELPPESLSNLHVLDVRSCTNLKNVSVFLQRLPNLEKLYLLENDAIDYVFETTGFQPKQSKLREMRLSRLRALRSICNGPTQHPMFQNLKLLVICDCNKLQSVFASDVAECLSQLEVLFVEWCSRLECVIEARKEAAMNKKKIILPKLKSLVLSELPSLWSVSAITIELECPSLEHLYVRYCPLYGVPAPQFQSKKQVQFDDAVHYWRMLMLYGVYGDGSDKHIALT